MRPTFWIGLVVLVLGVLSLLVPVPSNAHKGIRLGDASVGIETTHSEKVSPIISAVLILGGAGLMIAGRPGRA